MSLLYNLFHYTMQPLVTDRPGLELAVPDVERDAPASLRWLSGETGRQTLRLMGTPEAIQNPTLETERARIESFLSTENHRTWMIRQDGRTIGAVWVVLKHSRHVPAPAVHIMIGDPEYRGQGIGTSVISSVANHLRRTDQYDTVNSRHLADNTAAARLLAGAGFEPHGRAYRGDDGLTWQNVRLEL